MNRISFSRHPTRAGRRHYVTESDVRVVLDRLPRSLWKRLSAVHFNDRTRGNRRLGYVTRGRDAIALCALPARVSLSRGRASDRFDRFGAVPGSQWPALAVRRYMLYQVFLHELGHLQVIDPKANAVRRRFAVETRAQEFAEHWGRELWSSPFDHPDPVHNPPASEELATLRRDWLAAHSDYKRAHRYEKARRYDEAVELLTRAVDRYPAHSFALERLGALTYFGLGTESSTTKAVELLQAAVRLDPSAFGATLYLALSLSWEDREAEARPCFERAIALAPHRSLPRAYYADAIADWGHFDEAERRFRATIRKFPRCVIAVRDYGRTLIREHHPDRDRNLGRAIALFERAVKLNDRNAESHYRLGDALSGVAGEQERAITHLRRALALRPTHADAAAALAEMERTLGDRAPSGLPVA